MNPPYGRDIGKWMKKAFEESQKEATIVCLVPARTDTYWWHEYAMKGEIRLIRGRLKFSNAQNGAPFPSAIVVFRGGSRRTAESRLMKQRINIQSATPRLSDYSSLC